MPKFISTLLLLFFSASLPALAASASSQQEADLSQSPIYSKYDFGNSYRQIDFGIQPLSVPIGVICEVMKRDRILRKALADIGYEIRFHPFLKGDDINYFLKRNKIDVAMAGDMPTISIASSHDIVVTALAKQGFTSIVTKEHQTVNGLKGRRIGYPPVSNAHYGLLAALAAAGLKESDVRLVPMENRDMVDALDNDKVDAFAAWEPTPTIALKKIKNAVTIHRYLNTSYLYFSRSMVDQNPEAVNLVMASMIRALGWMKQREDNLHLAGQWLLSSVKVLQAQTMPLTVEEIARLTINDILSIASSPMIPQTDLSENGALRQRFDFLKARNKIPAGVSWQKIRKSFDRSITAGVLKNPKKYRLNIYDYDMGNSGQ